MLYWLSEENKHLMSLPALATFHSLVSSISSMKGKPT